MNGILRLCATALMCASTLALANSPVKCYVIGDPGGSKPNHPIGSQQNPYDSLAAVQADAQCELITVLYSDAALDGGIALKDGQELRGQKDKQGKLPVITNTNPSALGGVGVVLARNNRLSALHISGTHNSGVVGTFDVQGFGGTQVMHNLVVSGANQSGGISAFGASNPSIGMAATEDLNLVIENSDIGQAATASIGLLILDGSAEILISNTTVRDQGHTPAPVDISPGIAVYALNAASVDLSVIATKVTNIGEGHSNSDGLLLLNTGWGTMNALVDGYKFSNPDGGGGGSATGIEMGFFGSSGGGIFNGKVVNSTIDGSNSAGIQVLDQRSQNGFNSLNTELRGNKITNCSTGMSLGGQFFASHGNYSVEVSDNTISNSSNNGIGYAAGFGALSLQQLKIENNSILYSGGAGMSFALIDGTIDVAQIDAGLGVLGSEGQNRIVGSQIADVVVDGDIDVSAANNWWGSDTGPTSTVELNGGTVDVEPFLTTDPDP